MNRETEAGRNSITFCKSECVTTELNLEHSSVGPPCWLLASSRYAYALPILFVVSLMFVSLIWICSCSAVGMYSFAWHFSCKYFFSQGLLKDPFSRKYVSWGNHKLSQKGGLILLVHEVWDCEKQKTFLQCLLTKLPWGFKKWMKQKNLIAPRVERGPADCFRR